MTCARGKTRTAGARQFSTRGATQAANSKASIATNGRAAEKQVGVARVNNTVEK